MTVTVEEFEALLDRKLDEYFERKLSPLTSKTGSLRSSVGSLNRDIQNLRDTLARTESRIKSRIFPRSSGRPRGYFSGEEMHSVTVSSRRRQGYMG